MWWLAILLVADSAPAHQAFTVTVAARESLSDESSGAGAPVVLAVPFDRAFPPRALGPCPYRHREPDFGTVPERLVYHAVSLRELEQGVELLACGVAVQLEAQPDCLKPD
jgi:hypothetical protein